MTVETPNGVSNSKVFTYGSSGGAVAFFNPTVIASAGTPTRGVWGPDGRLYVASVTGNIYACTLNDAYVVTNTQVIPTLSTSAKPAILGITFNPFDPPSPVKIYVAHSALFADGGSCVTSASTYKSQVSVLTGPNFNIISPLITNLPASNHDHAVNGMQFDNYGDLLIAVGGNTNAGVKHCNIGDLPESPLTAAILIAETSNPSFNGTIQYLETATGLTNSDQRFGGVVDVAPGVDVRPFSVGFRNPFSVLLHTNGWFYALDNGPNTSFGAALSRRPHKDRTQVRLMNFLFSVGIATTDIPTEIVEDMTTVRMCIVARRTHPFLLITLHR